MFKEEQPGGNNCGRTSGDSWGGATGEAVSNAWGGVEEGAGCHS